MRYKVYKVNSSFTSVEEWTVQDIKYYTEEKGYFKNQKKAMMSMLLKRLELEDSLKRQKKIKSKINKLIENFPEAMI